MKFKSLEDPVCTSDPYYDLTDGGYINPEMLLEDAAQAEKVIAAAQLIQQFFEEAEEAGVIELV